VNAKAKKLKEFSQTGRQLNFKKQAIFFLNAYWKEHGQKECEHCWRCIKGYINEKKVPIPGMETLEEKKGEDGCALDEFKAHIFLQNHDQPQTAVELRQALKEIDVDTDKQMSFLEYVVWKYKLDIDDFMSRPQGVSKALEEAETKLNEIGKQIVKMKKYQKSIADKEKDADKLTDKQKMAIDADKKSLEEAEKFLVQALDFAEKKLKAAAKATDVTAQGKEWWLNREFQEAAKYKPGKKS
jgi:hypothetical protein